MNEWLDLKQDLPFQYRQWKSERIGWGILALFIAAALGGLFGHHPLARTSASSSDGHLVVTYDRFARYGSQSDISVRIKNSAFKEGTVRLWIDESYLNDLYVQVTSPFALPGDSREGSRAFVFKATGEDATMSFALEFRSLGRLSGRVRLDDGTPVTLSHFIWP
ncbi:hypothetical protein W02_31240 [Nitrospira sp. KM1]|uniref:hypothetical protein n=1 Tax=Nitrospira sp. KM1 TaxID=1936990 RepID=UPI0013A7459A|nr:hypothetical protein [Nitrospira sp. KM1]BCA55984.1 hypothetical protein W02_31240 [Nitrospira sp. KM1]